MNGIKRNIESKILQLLQQFPIVAILGVRQSGKTTLSKQLLPDWKYIDLENPRDYDRFTHDPLFFFNQFPQAVIIDEAQEYPELFRILRSVVDEKRRQTGRYLLTGSSSPELIAHISESLAGRIAVVELGTLKANEFYRLPLSPFYELFTHKLNQKNVIRGMAPLSNQQMQKVWLQGGYPEPVLHNKNNFYEQWMENYQNTYLNRDIAKLFPKLNKIAYRRFLVTLGKLSGTILNKRDVARAIEVSEGTIKEYISIAEGTYLWRSLTSFEKNIIKAVVKMPKGHIRDSGLLHHFLQIHDIEDLYSSPIVGTSFESFVIEEILKGLESTMVTNTQAYYYRTRNGAEIDLVLDGPFGVLPIEIKHNATVNFRQLTALNQFVEEHALPFGMLINQSDTAEWISPRIVQIPVGWL
jgi:predicted AAA+ superfamily ATPase